MGGWEHGTLKNQGGGFSADIAMQHLSNCIFQGKEKVKQKDYFHWDIYMKIELLLKFSAVGKTDLQGQGTRPLRAKKMPGARPGKSKNIGRLHVWETMKHAMLPKGREGAGKLKNQGGGFSVDIATQHLSMNIGRGEQKIHPLLETISYVF